MDATDAVNWRGTGLGGGGCEIENGGYRKCASVMLELSLDGACSTHTHTHAHSQRASVIHSLLKRTTIAHLVSFCVSLGWRRRQGECLLDAHDNNSKRLNRPYLICDQICPQIVG